LNPQTFRFEKLDYLLKMDNVVVVELTVEMEGSTGFRGNLILRFNQLRNGPIEVSARGKVDPSSRSVRLELKTNFEGAEDISIRLVVIEED